MHRGGAKPVSCREPHGAVAGLAKLRRVRQHGCEYRLQFARRARDDAQHLGGRGLLLQRRGQLSRAILDLLFESRIGLFQLAGHVVELVGEAFELVAGLDRNALAEIAAADALSAGLQGLDRHHHSARQENAGEDRQRQAQQQQQARTLDRLDERRVGLLARQLDEHQPTGCRDRRVGGQHVAAADILRLLQGFLRDARGRRARRLHLREPRHVGVAQHQADVGVRDQAALRVDHVGLPVLADLDLRDDLPDQLEVDLGHAHPGVAARAGERQGHVGLGFAAEIDRAVIDLLRHRLDEFRVLGVVGLAGHHVHGEPRHLELLLAGGIELGQLGDRRHLAQQPQPVEAPRLDGARRPRQLRRPADLALDRLDELVDLLGGGGGLLALNADQRGLVLAIGEGDLEYSVADQRHAHDGDEQQDVFAEQRPADLSPADLFRAAREDGARPLVHSITSSARTRNDSESVRSIALAAWRLMTSSNRVGTSIGRLAGLSPLRILSTRVANRR